MRLRPTIFVSLLALVMAMIMPTPAALAAGAGQFIVRCPFDNPANPSFPGVVGLNGAHAINDDPIVGTPSHLHLFFGNRSTFGGSTQATMLAVSQDANGTTCGYHKDTAGYWIPSIYLGPVANPSLVFPIKIHAYYNGLVGGTVEVPTPGAQLVGNKGATAPPGTGRLLWHCGENGANITPKVTHPYDCDATDSNGVFLYAHDPNFDGIIAVITMPQCWNDLSGLGWTAFTYVNTKSACTTDSHHHWIEQVQIHVHTGITSPCPQLAHSDPQCYAAASTTTFNAVNELWTGTNLPGQQPSFGQYWTMHGDWWNTWDQAQLIRLTGFINQHLNCGTVSDAHPSGGSGACLP